MKTYHVRVTFTEPLLGTVPQNKKLYSDYIGAQAPEDQDTADEEASVPEMLEKRTTGFHRGIDDTPILYDYALKGFFKDACGMMRMVSGAHSSAVTSYRKKIDGLVFIAPRQIPIQLAGPVTFLERPLRAQTPRGERVSLARSEMIPAGSSIEFDVEVLDVFKREHVVEWLEYGAKRGLGQWRNSGWGRFQYELTER